MGASGGRTRRNGFVFIRQAGRAELDRILRAKGLGGVRQRFATRLVGRFQGFVAVDASSITAIDDYVSDTIQATGTVRVETHVQVGRTPKGLKRGMTLKEGAIVRITVEHGKADEVLRAVLDIPGVGGASIVTGSVDVIAEVAGKTFGQVERALFAVQQVAGIRSTETLLLAGAPVFEG